MTHFTSDKSEIPVDNYTVESSENQQDFTIMFKILSYMYIKVDIELHIWLFQ